MARTKTTNVEKEPKQVEFIVNKAIKEEFERLSAQFAKLPEKEFAVALPLIQNASFLCVTLRRLQNSISLSDLSGEYQNGDRQTGRKCSTELQTYNALIKDYTAIMSKLLRLLPKEEPEHIPFKDMFDCE